MVTAYISIGNSDDKLSQADWSAFVQAVRICVRGRASAVYGEWYSAPDSPWQNMCMCAVFSDPDIPYIKKELTSLRTAHKQDSVAFAVTQAEMI